MWREKLTNRRLRIPEQRLTRIGPSGRHCMRFLTNHTRTQSCQRLFMSLIRRNQDMRLLIRPYAEKSAESEAPYEPYRGMWPVRALGR